MTGSIVNISDLCNQYCISTGKNTVHNAVCMQNPISIFSFNQNSKKDKNAFEFNDFKEILPQEFCNEDKIDFSPEVLRKNFEKTKEEQGFIGRSWDWTKNLFGMKSGSKYVEEQIKKLEEGKISFEEAQKTFNSYAEGQKQVLDVVADLGSATVAAGCYAAALGGAVAAPFTGGASLGLTAAAIAGASAGGAVTKTAIKGIDAISGGREYTLKESLVDASTGAINGPLAFATAGAGLVVAKAGTKLGIPAAKAVLNSMQSKVVTGFGKSVVTSTLDNTAVGLAKTGFTQKLVFNTLEGATSGAVYGGGTEACNYTINSMASNNPFKASEMLKSMGTGALGGFVLGGALSAGATTIKSIPKSGKTSASKTSAKTEVNSKDLAKPDVTIKKPEQEILKQVHNEVKGEAEITVKKSAKPEKTLKTEEKPSVKPKEEITTVKVKPEDILAARSRIRKSINNMMPVPEEFGISNPTPRQIDSSIKKYLELYKSKKQEIIDFLVANHSEDIATVSVKPAADKELVYLLADNIYEQLIKNPKNKIFLEKWGKDGRQLIIHYFEHGIESNARIEKTFLDGGKTHPKTPDGELILSQRNMRRYSNITEENLKRVREELKKIANKNGETVNLDAIPQQGKPIKIDGGKYKYARVLTPEGKIKEFYYITTPNGENVSNIIIEDGILQTNMHTSLVDTNSLTISEKLIKKAERAFINRIKKFEETVGESKSSELIKKAA